MEDIIRVLKVIEYKGPRKLIEALLEKSLLGSKIHNKIIITRCSLNPISAEVISIKTTEEEKSEVFFDFNIFLARLQDSFFHQLSVKTGWGKNQVIELFKEVLRDLSQDTEGL